MSQKEEDVVEQMNAVKLALEQSKEFGLEVEVITWAFKYLKADPELTISQAISYGFAEWVK